MKTDIRNLSFDELKAYCEAAGEPAFRAQQAFEWIHKKGVTDFSAMHTLPETFRRKMQGDFVLAPLTVAQQQVSHDGTTKFLFDLEDHQKIESVLIPTATRTTACISTQAGCKFGCRFCASGIGGWARNLSTAEIVAEILHVRQASQKLPRSLSHIVFMGTGESLDNYDHLLKAIRIINSPQGVHIGARRITISTVGIIPKIKQLAKEGLQIELAISLHGYDNESRNLLIPANRKYPFEELIAACREYIQATKRQVTFEYILIKGITCTPKAARELGRHLKGMICKMNLIPYNPVAEFPHETPSREEIFDFRRELEKYSLHATIRTPRGRDVGAACGQLRHASQKF